MKLVSKKDVWRLIHCEHGKHYIKNVLISNSREDGLILQCQKKRKILKKKKEKKRADAICLERDMIT